MILEGLGDCRRGAMAGDMAREGILSREKQCFHSSTDTVICIQMEDCWMDKQEQQCLLEWGWGGDRDLIRGQRREICFLFLEISLLYF